MVLPEEAYGAPNQLRPKAPAGPTMGMEQNGWAPFGQPPPQGNPTLPTPAPLQRANGAAQRAGGWQPAAAAEGGGGGPGEPLPGRTGIVGTCKGL